ncbi:MAG TPA: nucleoside triphosphate pyrophosphohydrolase [Paludibacteraceae bacterium]|nr:nucleoside triphosphate pyrophosphohydrolase [Paludibacteraceae bacterium]HPD27876.1 nucleoside triphosphate pyrophosphohydrolase [Paludibacteraceae bacterium]HRR59257.1 nucleoside triphosphate pyrophosphohydrolase [Paludibacteraceae bacterium]
MHTREEVLASFSRLLDVMTELRQKCPWDKKQTFQSLRCNTIEEVYELTEAIMRNDKSDIVKELGDVLLHIVFYAQIGSETNDFDMKEVCDKLCDKLIFRHPHIYGNAETNTPEEVKQNWENLKLKEKDGNKSVLSGVPATLPALIKAYRIQDKAANVGFDWSDPAQVWNKVREELQEVEDEVVAGNSDAIEAEIGDLLFSIVNAARLYHVNPENAIERTNQKFIRRFNYLEQKTIKQGKDLHQMSLEEMDIFWNEAKKQGL